MPGRWKDFASFKGERFVSNDFLEGAWEVRVGPVGPRLLGKNRASRIKFPPGSDSNFNCNGSTTSFGNSKHDPLMAR
jgi:hypothetical protein